MDNRENVRKESKKAVLIIIPAYNEEKNIVPLLEKLEQPEITQFADVLVMNDASQDKTNHVTKKRNHTVITHVFNLGYGSGLQLGYKYAVRKGYRYVIQMDADGQHDVCNLLEIYKELQKEDENGKLPDIVLGSRFMEGKFWIFGFICQKDCICMVSYNVENRNWKKNYRSDYRSSRIKLENLPFLFEI